MTMKKKINVNRVRYLNGNFEHIIMIVLTDKDPKKLELKTQDIENVVRYEKMLLIHPGKKFQKPKPVKVKRKK